jgi:uncharacterized protein YprB with RNaseH-like and TPR domain
MKINPFNLKKAELQSYLTGSCKHRMPYQQHPNCFRQEILNNDKPIKRGFLDIEFVNFKANYGCILTYAIKVQGKNKYYTGKLDKKLDLEDYKFDKRIVSDLVSDIKKFDEIITFYGTRCDIPYIRTRALKYGFDFPFYGYVKHKDIYFLAKFKLSLSSNSLETVCQLLGVKGKNHMNPDMLLKGLLGHEKSLNDIMIHNLRDVRITEKAYNRLINYARKSNRSL